MENVRTGSAVFATAKRTGRKCGIRMSYIGGQFSCNQEVSKVRGAPESHNRWMEESIFAAVRRKK